MTDKELAKDYAQTECCNSCTDSCKKNKCKMYCNVRNAVLYGLKAGKDMAEADLATIACMQGAERYKTKWHKVADGDLPKDARYVWTNVGAGYHDDDGWWDDFGRLQNVIAWCEPKFEE